MREPTELSQRLGKELHRLRDLAGISGRQMAKKIRVSQPTMTRIDRGAALPSMAAVETWLTACEVDDDTRARILDLAEAAHGEMKPWAELLEGEQHLQDRERDRDAAATRICTFQPTVIPGLLQTPVYARAVLQLGRTDVAAAVASRMARQALLHQPGRRLQFVLAEHLLNWSPAAGALAGQADRLQQLATLDTVDLAVLPELATPGRLPWHNFVIRQGGTGRAWVAAELLHGAYETGNPETVRIYEEAWEKLWEVATHGEEALELIRKT